MEDSMSWSELFEAWTEGMSILGVSTEPMPAGSNGQVAGWAPRNDGSSLPEWLPEDSAVHAAREIHKPERLAAALINSAAYVVDGPMQSQIINMTLARLRNNADLPELRLTGSGMEQALAAIAFRNAAFLKDWGPVARVRRTKADEEPLMLDAATGAALRRQYPLSPPLAWLRTRSWGKPITSFVRGEVHRIADLDDIVDMSMRIDTSPVESIVDFHMLRAIDQRLREKAGVAMGTTASRTHGLTMFMRRREEETEIAQEISDWIDAGSQIFVFGRDLHRELAMTDVDDVTADELRMPYDAIYVGFEDVDVQGVQDQPLDGFMVSTDRDNQMMYITPMSRIVPDIEKVGVLGRRIMIDLRERGENVVIDIIDDEADILEETADAYLEQMLGYENEDKKLWQTSEERDAAIEMARQIAAATTRGADVMRANKHRWASLVVNALLYIDHCGGGERRYADEAPADLVDKICRSAPGARKAQQKLVAMGHAPITRLDLPRAERGLGEDVGPGGPKRSHWRRGHWRRQGCGVGRKQVKRVRVRPTLVGADHDMGAGPRTYRISKPRPRDHDGDGHAPA